jgi:hypothetical protein
MSLYREVRGRRWAAIAGALAAGVAIGALAGFLVGRGSEDESSLSEQVAELRSDAQPLRLALEQVMIEYQGTVEGGEVASPTEFEASVATAERALASLEQLRPDLAAVNAAETARLDRAVRSLSELIERRAAYSAVEAKAAEAQQALSSMVSS